MLARPPAGAPAGGCVACRVPAPGLPPSSPMPRGPPPRDPPLFPECMDPDGNRMGADSCAPVGPAAASGPGFHIRWPPSVLRVSARAIPVSVDGRGPPADARVPRFTMDLFFSRSNTSVPVATLPAGGWWAGYKHVHSPPHPSPWDSRTPCLTSSDARSARGAARRGCPRAWPCSIRPAAWI